MAATDTGDTQRAALLQAIAQAGQAGAQAQLAQSTDNAAQGQQAAAAALSTPGAAQAPGGFADSLARQAAAPNIAAAEGIGRTSQAQSIYNTGMLGAAGTSQGMLQQQEAAQAQQTAQDVGTIAAQAARRRANEAEAKAANTRSLHTVRVYNPETGKYEDRSLNLTESEFAGQMLNPAGSAPDKLALTPAEEHRQGFEKPNGKPVSANQLRTVANVHGLASPQNSKAFDLIVGPSIDINEAMQNLAGLQKSGLIPFDANELQRLLFEYYQDRGPAPKVLPTSGKGLPQAGKVQPGRYAISRKRGGAEQAGHNVRSLRNILGGF